MLSVECPRYVFSDRSEAGPYTPQIVLDFFADLQPLRQPEIDWLVAQDVPGRALGNADQHGDVLKLAYGSTTNDAWFGQQPDGQPHIAILIYAWPDDPIDIAVWQPRTGGIGSYFGRAAAFGEAQIENPATYSFGGGLTVHKTPLEWLIAERKGICIIRPERVAARLSKVPKLIAADVAHGRQIEKLIQPRMPQVCVLASRRDVA